MKKLSSEAIQNIRLLLDKPISPLTQKQLVDIINKEILPTQTLIPMLTSKYRGDILAIIMKKQHLTVNTIKFLFQNLRKDILKYPQDQLHLLFKLALKQEEMAFYRGDEGIFIPLDEGLKRTNEESKEKLFWLINSNIEVMRELGQAKIIENFVNSFIKNYLKQNIYLPSYSALALLCLKVDSQIQKQLIQSSTKRAIFDRTLIFLENVSSKLCYSFQNYCLKVVSHLLNEEKETSIDLLSLHHCKKVLQMYLWKKPTREEARSTQQAMQKEQKKFAKEEEGKRQYVSIEKEEEKPIAPLLIEKVIERVNQYRQNKHVDYTKVSSVIQTRNFKPKKRNQTPIKSQLDWVSKKNYFELESMVQKCFNDKEKEKKQSMLPINSSVVPRQQLAEDTIKTVSSVASSRVEDFDQFVEVSNLIDLAYQYKFQ